MNKMTNKNGKTKVMRKVMSKDGSLRMRKKDNNARLRNKSKNPELRFTKSCARP